MPGCSSGPKSYAFRPLSSETVMRRASSRSGLQFEVLRMDTDTAGLTVAIAAAIIALGALLLSAWQASELRRHNRLSLAPRLRFDYNLSPHLETIGVNISNNGFGPALIDDFAIILDDQPLPREQWNNLTSLLGLQGILQYGFPTEDDVIKKEESIPLLAMLAQDVDKDMISRVKQALKRVGFEIHFSSLYKERVSFEHSGVM